MSSFHNRQEGECLIICVDCNGYLWSEPMLERNGKTVETMRCPYRRSGKCQPGRKDVLLE